MIPDRGSPSPSSARTGPRLAEAGRRLNPRAQIATTARIWREWGATYCNRSFTKGMTSEP